MAVSRKSLSVPVPVPDDLPGRSPAAGCRVVEAGVPPRAPRRAITILEPLLTIEQTAGLLQVSSKTIRRHIRDGRLIAHRIGTQWRIAQRDLDLYLRDARRGL